MHIFVALLRPPFPPIKGDTVIAYNWIKRWGETHSVTAIWFGEDDASVEAMRPYCKTIRTVPLRRDSLLKRAARIIGAHEPGSFGRHDMEALNAVAAEVGQSQRFDAAFLINANFIAQFDIGKHLGASVVVVPIDSMTLKLRRRVPYSANPLMRWYWRHQADRWAEAHAAHLPNFGGVIAVNAEDAASMIQDAPKLSRREVRVIPNGVDTTFFAADAVRAADMGAGPRIVFSGVMSSEQSETAAMFFHPVFKALQARHPDLTWWIVGRNPTRGIRELAAANPSVHVTGMVDDIRPYLKGATVCVAPMLTGAGMKNRVLEAMAMGGAVVSTPEGISGIGDANHLPVRIASGQEAFGSAVDELLRDSSARADLGTRSRDYVIKYHSWQHAADEALAFACRSTKLRIVTADAS